MLRATKQQCFFLFFVVLVVKSDLSEVGRAGMEEIDLEMGPGYDDGAQFDPGAHTALIEQHGLKPTPRKKKKVVKRWRDEWAETYKWAYVAVHEGTHRIFCSVCKEYGRKHRRNPYGNEGSRNMQMSALEEHNNSLLHKEALRLQMASRDKGMGLIERPLYIKGKGYYFGQTELGFTCEFYSSYDIMKTKNATFVWSGSAVIIQWNSILCGIYIPLLSLGCCRSFDPAFEDKRHGAHGAPSEYKR